MLKSGWHYLGLPVALLLAAALLNPSSAQPTLKDNSPGFRDWMRGAGTSTLGLLDPSRLTVQHSLSFGVASGGGGTLTQSLYTSRFGYKLSDPLTLSVLLGFQNTNFGGRVPYSGSFNSLLGGVALNYQPSDDFFLHFELLRAPGSTLYDGGNYRFRALPSLP